MTSPIKTYSEVIGLKTFEERFNYLKLDGSVGATTFGYDRYLNQALYSSYEWKSLRHRIIVRDKGCDLASEDHLISGRILIHHLNPLTSEDIINRCPNIFDPENLICVSFTTHNALHYGNESLINSEPATRKPNDTCLWKKQRR